MTNYKVSKARVRTQINSSRSNRSSYQKLSSSYGSRMSSDKLGEYKIVKSLSPSLVRNIEGDNTLESSSVTMLNIIGKSGNTITLNSLPRNLINSLDIDWFVQNLDPSNFNFSEPSYSGDYLVQDKVVSFNFDANEIELTNASDFDIWDDILIYSPWINYEFVGDQTTTGILYKDVGVTWRSRYINTGPSWYNYQDKLYYTLVNGRSNEATQHVRIGYATSPDLINWTYGNADDAIITISDHADFSIHVIAGGNVVELDDGKIAFAVTGFGAAGQRCHIIKMNKDCSGIEISDSLIAGSVWYSSAICKFNNRYYLSVTNATSANINEWTNELWSSKLIDGPYVKNCDIITTQYDTNDSVFIEGHIDAMNLFVEDGEMYLIVAGTARYIVSGIQGNRTLGIMKYDKSSNSFSIPIKYAPEIIYPMYFYNIASEDYDWAAGHVGGYPSFIKKDGKCYMFTAFLETANTYQAGLLELKNNN